VSGSGVPPAGPGPVGGGSSGEGPRLTRLVAVPTFRDQPSMAAVDIDGVDLNGRTAHLRVDHPGTFTLLLFLKSNCDGCGPLWEAVADPGAHGLGGLEVAGVIRIADRKERSAMRRLVPRSARPRVMVAPQAFTDYRVHGGPFFVLVDGSGPVVATEGVAWALDQLRADVARARTARSG
jgi:hypothetical protein